MKKRLFLVILGFSGFLVAMEKSEKMEVEPTSSVVTLVSSSGKEFTIPQPAAELSGTIKGMLISPLAKEAQTRRVVLRLISAEVLASIINTLEKANEQKQKQEEKLLEQRNFVFRPDDSDFESANGGFIAQNIQPIVDPVLSPLGGVQVAAVAKAADFLDIPFLLNASARVYVEKYVAQNPQAELNNLVTALAQQNVPETIYIYFKKHFTLKQAGAEKELSIADYLALGGNPSDLGADQRGLRWFSFIQKGITSLYGIDQIKNPGAVSKLDLAFNYILGQERDPDYYPGLFSKFEKLEELNLNGSQITTIKTGTFSGLARLGTLNLYNNRIQNIEPDAFRGLGSLEDLNLENNQMQTIPLDAFRGLNGLKFLFLGGNQIQTISSDAFRGLDGLKFLFLEGNRIQTIPSDAFNGLDKLERLHLRSNPLAESAEQIKQQHFPNRDVTIEK